MVFGRVREGKSVQLRACKNRDLRSDCMLQTKQFPILNSSFKACNFLLLKEKNENPCCLKMKAPITVANVMSSCRISVSRLSKETRIHGRWLCSPVASHCARRTQERSPQFPPLEVNGLRPFSQEHVFFQALIPVSSFAPSDLVWGG